LSFIANYLVGSIFSSFIKDLPFEKYEHVLFQRKKLMLCFLAKKANLEFIKQPKS